MNTRPLSPIGGGLNESVAPSEQPAGSYVRGVNVRGVGPKSGRVVWGAQRAGLTQLGSAFDGGYARHFATASQLISAREWVDLTIAGDPQASPEAVAAARSTVIGERALAVATGVDGQAYVLGQSGSVAILNTKGVEVDRIPSAVPQGYSSVGRIFTDSTGGVYTAARLQTETGALAPGRVFRWVRDAEGVWDTAWDAETDGPVESFVYDRGALYIAEGPFETDSFPVLPALSRVGSPLLGSQLSWRETRIAYPIVDLAVTRRGQCLASSPASVDRQVASGGYGTRQVSWTPFEESSFPTQCWAWLDAFAVNDENATLEDGEEVDLMRDRRFEPSEFPAIDDESPERVLRSVSSDIIDKPVYNEFAFGGAGGILFSGAASLVSGPSTSATDPNEQLTIIPGALDTVPSTPLSADFTVCMMVELTTDQVASTGARQILQQEGDTGDAQWLLTANSDDVTWTEDTDAATATGEVESTSEAAVLSLESTAGSMSLYINGEEVDTASTTAFAQGGAFDGFEGPFTVLGGLKPNRNNILQAAGTTLNYYTGAGPTLGLIPSVSRLTDGVLTEPDVDIGPAGGAFGAFPLYIDLGSAKDFDSFSFWSTSFDKSASQVRLEASNDADFASGVVTQIVNGVTRGAGSPSPPSRDDFQFDGAGTPYRYIRVTPTLFHNGNPVNTWEVSEVAFYEQDFASINDTAEVNIGEVVTFTQANDSLRERLEGYLAHRWGISAELVAADGVSVHEYRDAPPVGAGSTPQDTAIVASALASPFPVLAKYGTDGTPLAAITGGGVGLASRSTLDDIVFSIGDPTPDGLDPSASTYGTLLTKFTDESRDLSEVDTFDSTDRPAPRRAPMAIGPCNSIIVGVASRVNDKSLRRFDGDDMTEVWSYVDSVDAEVSDLSLAGAQIDLESQGQACGPEYVYATGSALGQARRIDVLGLLDTGVAPGRSVERLAVLSNGDVVRNSGAGWDVVEAGALKGSLPHSATLFGQTVFADGFGYRSYDHANRTLRDFEEAVKGTLPPRCQLIAAYRSRLILARGDNAFTIYQSAFGEPFNFDIGTEVETISQAVAGTVAAQGKVPEPITALMPWRDDYLFIGTTESLFVLSGDLADGGRLDQVDKSQGVAFGYAWCESPGGIYYFSARGGLMRLVPGGGLEVVSAGRIQRRLEDIDLETSRVRLVYNWIDKAVHIFVIPKALGSDTQHFVYEEPLRAWHIDDFGPGYANAITTADALIGDAPDDRTVILGKGDGSALVWDQYADDDAGTPIASSVLVGPLSPGSAGMEVALRGIYGELASDQGPVEVAGRASNVADVPGPPGTFGRLDPGRGYGVGVNMSAPAVFVEVRGVGRPWEIHGLRVEAHNAGYARRTT